MKSYLLLWAAAFIWGTTFVAQITGMEGIGPFTYAALRYLLGFVFMLIVWRLLKKTRERQKRQGKYVAGWRVGIVSGLIMFVATSLQQVAMVQTTAGKTAFITALYMILVPLGAVFLGKKIGRENWCGAILAIIGLYLLSIQGETSLQFGDILVFISAFFWAGQILFIDRHASRVDAIELSAAQIGVCCVGSWLGMLLFEDVNWTAAMHDWFSIFYGGVFSAGIAFTLQIFGQKHAEPGPAAIIMSFESVFGALSGWLLLGEVMSASQVFGCVLMMAGVLTTQARTILPHFARR